MKKKEEVKRTHPYYQNSLVCEICEETTGKSFPFTTYTSRTQHMKRTHWINYQQNYYKLTGTDRITPEEQRERALVYLEAHFPGYTDNPEPWYKPSP